MHVSRALNIHDNNHVDCTSENNRPL